MSGESNMTLLKIVFKDLKSGKSYADSLSLGPEVLQAGLFLRGSGENK